MAKHVVFVLDVSGSMNGKKLIQVKNAMKSILNQLRDIDFFSILHFSDVVTEWRLEATAATKGQKISIGNCDFLVSFKKEPYKICLILP